MKAILFSLPNLICCRSIKNDIYCHFCLCICFLILIIFDFLTIDYETYKILHNIWSLMMYIMQLSVLAGMLGQWEIWVILVIALLIFGKRLPDIAGASARVLHHSKKGSRMLKTT